MKKLIVLSNWAQDTFYTEHFRTAVYGFLQNGGYPHISFIPVSSSIEAGYMLSVLVETEHRLGRPQETIIFTDLQAHDISEQDAAQPGQGQFTILRLASGMYVCGLNNGYVFYGIKKQIQHAFTYSKSDDISQISEREAYARKLTFFLESIEDDLELEETHTSSILEMRDLVITFQDATGNLYTNMHLDHLKGKVEFGEMIEIRSGEHVFQARLLKPGSKPHPGEVSLVSTPFGSVEIDTFYLCFTPDQSKDNPLTDLAVGSVLHL